ncbi:LOW QUALITY PROTEIN: tripartite motif-containing protein 16-like [Pholidichthys leucotaenia]
MTFGITPIQQLLSAQTLPRFLPSQLHLDKGWKRHVTADPRDCEEVKLRGEMAQKGVQLDAERFSCNICLDQLKDPVTIACGYNYCMNCINKYWDDDEEKKTHSCPQCRQTFRPRPVLVKNTMLAELVEELKRLDSWLLLVSTAAEAEDVACDFCTGRKLKAIKSCLVCQVSYCETHLQPHYDVAPLKKHKLVEPSKNLQENICSHHDEVMKILCRTDQQIICYLCSMDHLKGHDTVSAAAQRTERQREVEGNRRNIHQRIQDREEDVKLLQQPMEAINRSADKTVEDSEKMFTELIHLIQKSSDMKQQVRSQQETEVSRVKDLQEKVEQEISELKRRDTELEQLSRTEDDTKFLHSYPSLSAVCESTHSPSIHVLPLRYFEDVTAAVSELRDKLQELLTDTWTNISLIVNVVDGLQPQQEPKTRAEFLKYSQEITLDPNTVNEFLLLSEENRKVTIASQPQSYPPYPERFTDYSQALSKESLSECCYWEVEWSGHRLDIAVTCKNISKGGEESLFGYNDKSWALECEQNSFTFMHNRIQTSISAPRSSRTGVFLDHSTGLLSFYSIFETMTLLHRVDSLVADPLTFTIFSSRISTPRRVRSRGLVSQRSPRLATRQ